jgi:hypothetical protein
VARGLFYGLRLISSIHDNDAVFGGIKFTALKPDCLVGIAGWMVQDTRRPRCAGRAVLHRYSEAPESTTFLAVCGPLLWIGEMDRDRHDQESCSCSPKMTSFYVVYYCVPRRKGIVLPTLDHATLNVWQLGHAL